jgi:hypothetical protein
LGEKWSRELKNDIVYPAREVVDLIFGNSQKKFLFLGGTGD